LFVGADTRAARRMAATNKCLAQMNKSPDGAQSD